MAATPLSREPDRIATEAAIAHPRTGRLPKSHKQNRRHVVGLLSLGLAAGFF